MKLSIAVLLALVAFTQAFSFGGPRSEGELDIPRPFSSLLRKLLGGRDRNRHRPGPPGPNRPGPPGPPGSDRPGPPPGSDRPDTESELNGNRSSEVDSPQNGNRSSEVDSPQNGNRSSEDPQQIPSPNTLSSPVGVPDPKELVDQFEKQLEDLPFVSAFENLPGVSDAIKIARQFTDSALDVGKSFIPS